MTDIENEKDILTQYNDIIKSLGLEIKSKFVPFSVSRNSDEEYKSLNWKVTITSGTKVINVNYTKGVGSLPYPQTSFGVTNYQKRMINEAIDSAVETGIARKLTVVDKDIKFLPGNAIFPIPTLQEVLYSLSSDADVKNYLTYEQWASDMGFDTDSRKGEKIYDDCRKQTSEFMKLIGSEEKLTNLHEILYEMDNQSVTVLSKPKM